MTINLDEEKHEYTVDGVEVPSVSKILSALTFEGYAEINESVLRQASERGRAVHEATEIYDLIGCVDWEDTDLTPPDIPYLQAYIDFVNDYKPEWWASEFSVYNPEENYCGTIDRIGIINGKAVIIDLKTVAQFSRINYVAYACQLEAYARALKKGNPFRERLGYGIEFEMYLLQLKKDGSYRLIDIKKKMQDDGSDYQHIWDLCRELNGIKREVKARGTRRRENDTERIR